MPTFTQLKVEVLTRLCWRPQDGEQAGETELNAIRRRYEAEQARFIDVAEVLGEGTVTGKAAPDAAIDAVLKEIDEVRASHVEENGTGTAQAGIERA